MTRNRRPPTCAQKSSTFLRKLLSTLNTMKYLQRRHTFKTKKRLNCQGWNACDVRPLPHVHAGGQRVLAARAPRLERRLEICNPRKRYKFAASQSHAAAPAATTRIFSDMTFLSSSALPQEFAHALTTQSQCHHPPPPHFPLGPHLELNHSCSGSSSSAVCCCCQRCSATSPSM